MNTKMPKIAMGAWSWGAGAAGGDQVFGNHLFEQELKPVFDKAMELGLNLWDTAAVYSEGTSERILGNFVKAFPRDEVILSTKFTPQIADSTPRRHAAHDRRQQEASSHRRNRPVLDSQPHGCRAVDAGPNSAGKEQADQGHRRVQSQS